ncbi:hypothetical protein KZ829_22195 [Actinoplanes hulinensis]|uniref:Uncharacterized protein n=1 Tax=Actinoplanes hulinensis TaxID=1144547 RepID=A0ABS7B5X2_9ACTN|nr:hypothetical protein [Actinoplanes hulinensis]MBW6436456.1 hypothetical protein [Actinoplanes hulinensis]
MADPRTRPPVVHRLSRLTILLVIVALAVWFGTSALALTAVDWATTVVSDITATIWRPLTETS